MEERLKYLTAGTKPRKNKEVMDEVIQQLKEEGLYFGETKKANNADAPEEKKEKKKDKKRKHSEVTDDKEVVEKPKKKKKASH